MALSTRNRLPATITEVVKGEAAAKVALDVGGTKMVALITRESADELGLQEGQNVTALVKARRPAGAGRARPAYLWTLPTRRVDTAVARSRLPARDHPRPVRARRILRTPADSIDDGRAKQKRHCRPPSWRVVLGCSLKRQGALRGNTVSWSGATRSISTRDQRRRP